MRVDIATLIESYGLFSFFDYLTGADWSTIYRNNRKQFVAELSRSKRVQQGTRGKKMW